MVTPSGPPFPDFVVITITPLLALAPYKAAALAPLRTEIEAISSGARFDIPPIGIPSITYRGWLLPAMGRFPLISPFASAPTPVLAVVTETPATLPLRFATGFRALA